MTDASASATDAKLIQARNFTQANRSDVRWVVLHSTEGPRVKGAAAGVARWFAGASAPQASSHYVVDADEVVQCVAEKDIAWTQGQANRDSISIEIVGFARYTRDEWLDDYGEPQLRRVARLVAEICQRWQIPIEFVDAGGIAERLGGITTHAVLTQAYGVRGGHTDPGDGFPLDTVLEWAAEVAAEMDDPDGTDAP